MGMQIPGIRPKLVEDPVSSGTAVPPLTVSCELYTFMPAIEFPWPVNCCKAVYCWSAWLDPEFAEVII